MRIPALSILICLFGALQVAAAGPHLTVTADPPRVAQEMPSITIVRGRAQIAWRDGGIRTAQIGTPPGPVPASSVITLDETSPREVASATLGEATLAVWIKNDDVLSRLLGPDGTPVGPETPLAFVDSRLTSRAGVAASLTHFLVVWNERSRIMGKLVDRSGKASEEAFRIHDGPFGQNVDRIVVGSDGQEFLVVWEASPNEPWINPCQLVCPEGERSIRAVAVQSDGTPRALSETVIAASGEMPDVTWNGQEFLVVWNSPGGGGILARHVGMPFAALGQVRGLTTYAASGPRIAWAGSSYALAFVRLEPHALLAARVRADLSRVDELTAEPIIAGAHPRHFDIAAEAGRAWLSYSDGRLYLRLLDVQPVGRSRAARR